MTVIVYIKDREYYRATGLAKLLPEDVVVNLASGNTWKHCSLNRAGRDADSVTLLLHHLGDSWCAIHGGVDCIVYYGGTGPGDKRFFGDDTPPAVAVARAPAKVSNALSGWLLQRQVSSAESLGMTAQEMMELLGWVLSERRSGTSAGRSLPRVLVPPFVGADESALCALAFLCQCELAAHVKDGASLSVLSALKRAGLVDENGKTVDLGIAWERSAGLRLSAWSLGLGAAPKDVSTEKLSGENRAPVEALLTALGKGTSEDAGGGSEATPIDADLVARAYLALDRYFGGGAA